MGLRMSDSVTRTEELLREDLYTSSEIGNFTVEKFNELSGIIEGAQLDGTIGDVMALCTDKLSQGATTSITALYLVGMINLQNKKLDNSELSSLIEIFKKNKKSAIVTYLCESILQKDKTNKLALVTMAQIYEASKDERVWGYYERIIQVDFAEAEIAKKLAMHSEESGDLETAIKYYKKAILRYINSKNLPAVKEVWKKIIELTPDVSTEFDYFQLVKRNTANIFGNADAALLLRDLYACYKDKGDWDTAISILKEILEGDNQDSQARNELVACYKAKYAGHSHLDGYLTGSLLTQRNRSVFEAINDFEKHIAFDVGSFVFHKTWGVGKITKVDVDSITVNFGKKHGVHSMALSMAINSLLPLSKSHIWVQKATRKREDIASEVKDSPEKALRDIIQSFGSCDLKKIKTELCDQILTQSEWNTWLPQAKRILSANPSFGIDPDNPSMYVVRTHEMDEDERLANEFKAEKRFFNRIDIVMRYTQYIIKKGTSGDKSVDIETDKSGEIFMDMVNYFALFLKTLDTSEGVRHILQSGKVNEQVMASYLVIKAIMKEIPQLPFPPKYTFAEIYSKITDPCTIYQALKDTRNTSLQRDFLTEVHGLPKWVDEYVRLFPIVLKKEVIDVLIEAGERDKVLKLVETCFSDPKEYRDAVIFFWRECQDDEWYKACAVPLEKRIIDLIEIINITFREISNHINTTNNKRTNKNATDILFKNDMLLNYMFSQGEAETVKLYTMIDDIAELDSDKKTAMRNHIQETYPGFKFRVSVEKQVATKGMIVTAAMLKIKKELLERLQKVEVPKNAREIEEAREKGDLKENAEYKAAKEYQHKLNNDIAKLQSEINRSVVFDPTTATTAFVSFSTVVTLHNVDKNADEVYTILGPWESDPEHNVISYMAPFGNELMDAKVGEELHFKINDYKYSYIVKSIQTADN